MCRFIESIRVENRRLCNIEGHNRRLNETRRHFFGSKDEIRLEDFVVLADDISNSVYKCRVLYDSSVCEVQFEAYMPRMIRTLKLVEGGDVTYAFKFGDRSALNALSTLKDDADEILIVKDGCLTDTSFSNIALYDGIRWVTPDTFLLNGTMRQRLLGEGRLIEKRITADDLENYREVRLINAMLELETSCPVRIIG